MVRALLKSKGMSGHQQPFRGKCDTWLTPPEILKALGPFDLDPCCPVDMPWKTAREMIAYPNDGLAINWRGRVWLNPPYGPETGKWLSRLADHGRGIALVFARTETADWHEHIWQRASAILFLKGRLHFHDAAGVRAKANAGAPSALVAYGRHDAIILEQCGIVGKLICLSK